jgi:protein subunit release factor A
MTAHLHIFVNGRQFGPDDGVKEVMTGGEIATLVGVPIGPAVVRLDPRIDPKDLRIDTRRSPTPGRANTDCAVRITHLPTTLVAVSDSEISQIRNRAKAMQLLRIHLYESGHVQPRRISTYEEIRIEAGDHFSVSSL